MAETTYTVPRIALGSPATTTVLNAPLNYILNALNNIDSQINLMSNKSAIIQYQTPIASDVIVGDLVYYNKQTQKFLKAIAALAVQNGLQGQSVEADSSRVEGIILKKTDLTSAVMLKGGYYLDDSVAAAVFGSFSALRGIYYLSPTTAGKATQLPGWNMRQPCLSYYGDGKFSMLCNYLAHDNHHHTYISISLWKAAATYSGEDTKPQGAQYYYSIKNTDNTGKLSDTATVCFLLGILNTTQFKFTPNTAWYTGTLNPGANKVLLFNSYPFAYGDSVVRTVLSLNLSVKNYNGNVKINMPLYISNSNTISEYAICSIKGLNIYKTPVVTDIKAGSGIKVIKMGQGVYQINTTATSNTPVIVDNIHLVGAQRVSLLSGLVYTVFPGGISSYISITKNLIASYTLPVTHNIKIWATQKGTGSETLTCLLYWIPINEDGSLTKIPTSSNDKIGSAVLTANNTSAQHLKYISTDVISTSAISSPGVLMAKIIAGTSVSTSVYLHLIGFRILTVRNIYTGNSVVMDDALYLIIQ